MVKPDYDNIPDTLKSLPNWVGFRVWRDEKDNKCKKMPVDIKATVAAKKADPAAWKDVPAESNNPETWTTFDTAIAWLKNKKPHKKYSYHIGFAFDGSGIIGIDLDHCVGENGEPHGKYRILPYFWIPEANMEKRIRRDHVQYDAWQTKGYIMTTDGSVVDYATVEDYIKSCGKKFEIRQIAMDRWNGTATAQRLEKAGFTMIEFGQGFRSMTYPTKELMRLILDKKIAHNGNDALNWMLENMVVKTDEAGNVKPDKAKSAEHIDGAVALIMALDIALKGDGEPEGSVYDHRDLLIIFTEEFMPDRIWKQCKVAGCPGLTRGKYCDKHAHLEARDKCEMQARYNQTARDPEAQAFYESPEWRKLRALHLKRNPLCEKCFIGGRVTPAVIVDHKVEIRDGGGRLDVENLQSLCRACHNKKTAQERSNRKNGG